MRTDIKNVCFGNFGRSLGFALLLVVTSCSEHKTVITHYFDVDSLLNRQIRLLVENNATLEKEAGVGKERSSISFVPTDSAAWAQELDIFRNLNQINKPVNRGLYTETTERDRHSNLTVRSFVAQDEDVAITDLRIFFLNSPNDIRRIEAVYRQDNVMYTTKRRLRMDFRKLNQRPVISAYSVSGGQKMVLGDTVQYSVKAKISISGK